MEFETQGVPNEKQQGRSMSWSYVPRRRRILPGDAFFDDGNLETSAETHKQMPIETKEDESQECLTRHGDFKCHVKGCNQTFTTVQSYEIHYNGAHRNNCRYCRRAYPSTHLLDLHILESHDSLFEVMAQKQPMHQCLVESCSEKFADSQKRRDHLIKVHHYPADFRFQRGISKQRSHGTSKETSSTITPDDAMDTGAPTEGDTQGATHGDTSPPLGGDTPLAAMQPTASVASNQRQYKVPAHISFGRGGTRSFQRGQPRQQNKPKKNKGHALKQPHRAPKETHHAPKETHHAPKETHHAPKEESVDMPSNNIDERTEEEPMSITQEYS